MSDSVDSGICYTWSGDKKIYEPDLFSATINVFCHEYCYRYDSSDNKTLVFGNDDPNAESDYWSTYLPYGGVSINHNIQSNGEDHYSLSGTYTNPGNWSPPAGVDGPFDLPFDLEYPYYVHVISWANQVYTWYNDKINFLNIHGANGGRYYYGNKKDK